MSILIVGLGNPGEQYKNTRHNAGFMIIEELAKILDVKFSRDDQMDASVAETNVDGEKIILVKPDTFMNLSGVAVQKAVNKFKLSDAAQVWIAYDDASLPFGVLRVRLEGSSGGHNGVQSIIDRLGENDFVRFRFGVGEPAEPVKLEDWVLSKFSKSD